MPYHNTFQNFFEFSTVFSGLRKNIQNYSEGYGITFYNHERLPECDTKHSKEGSKTLLGKHRQVSDAFSLRTCQTIQKFRKPG
jgi:hypothetical protein